jgi:hypothetical protein
MPIDSLHPKYKDRLPQWSKCRDAFEGEDAIKAAGVKYLPKLKGQADDDYRSYKGRALFYSITSKSVSALVGMATSKAPKIEYPPSMELYFNDSRMIQFSEVYSSVLTEVLLQSRCGVLVDMPPEGGKPYPVVYQAEDILNWRIDSAGELELVVLREAYDEPTDEFEVEVSHRYRELRMVDGVYTQNVYSAKSEIVEQVIPTIRGVALDYIPFFVANPFGTGFSDMKPLMLDIANINISHYLSSADLEHGRHFTGLPTPVVIGADSDKDLYIGSTKFLVIPDKGGDAKYLEFTGQGLQSLEKAMSEKQSLLASLSARLLDNSSRGSEAADAVKLRYMSETASLTTVVHSISIVLNSAYKLIAEILGENQSDFSLMLDTDFMETQLSAPDMSALFDGFFKGAVSKETLVYNLRKGRRLDPLRSDSQEIEAIGVKQSEQPNNGDQSNLSQTINQ